MTSSELLEDNKVSVPTYHYQGKDSLPLLSFYKFLNRILNCGSFVSQLDEYVDASYSYKSNSFYLCLKNQYFQTKLQKIYLKINQYFEDKTIDEFISLLGKIRTSSESSLCRDFDVYSLFQSSLIQYRMLMNLFCEGVLFYRLSKKNSVISDMFYFHQENDIYSRVKSSELDKKFTKGIIISSDLRGLENCPKTPDFKTSQITSDSEKFTIQNLDLVFDCIFLNKLIEYSYSIIKSEMFLDYSKKPKKEILKLVFRENQLVLENLEDNSEKVIKPKFHLKARPYKLVQKLFQDSSCQLDDPDFKIKNNDFGKLARDFNLSTPLFKKLFLRTENNVSLNHTINLEDINEILNNSKNKKSCKTTLFVDCEQKIVFNIDTLKFDISN